MSSLCPAISGRLALGGDLTQAKKERKRANDTQLLPQHHGIITTSSSPNNVRTNSSPTTTTPLLISLQNCPPSLLTTMSKSSSRKHFSENDDIHNKNDGDALPLTIQSGGELFRSKMESFSSNVSRLRVKRKRHMLNRSGNNSDRGGKGEESIASIDNALIGACNSLVYFLRDEATTILINDETTNSLRELLEMVLIQTIRASSEVGNFVLLNKIVVAAVEYAHAFVVYVSSGVGGSSGSSSSSSSEDGETPTSATALLQPRIFGEAIASISKTKASVSKVKSLWNYFVHDVARLDIQKLCPPKEELESSSSKPSNTSYPSSTTILASPPTAYELNAVLSALADRGKVRAAIKLYRQFAVDTSLIEGDAYTASILFGMLSDSISSSGSKVGGDNYKENKAAASDVEEGAAGDQDATTSPCWQWNEAIELLSSFSPHQMNNVAYATLLKVNEKATEEYRKGASRHNGVKSALLVLERMKRDKISPDVVTCSALLTIFDKGRHWKAAISLLNAMQTSSRSMSRADGIVDNERWTLPAPNTFTYALAISACARCNKREVVLSLFDQMSDAASSQTVAAATEAEPNTWVYNTAIASCAENTLPGRSMVKSGVHLTTAFDILERLERNESIASPNTESYSIILSVLDNQSFAATKKSQVDGTMQEGTGRLHKHNQIEDVVVDILESMEARGIDRDVSTYSNAIIACSSNPREAIAIFRKSLSDCTLPPDASTGIIEIANAALSVAATSGDMFAVSDVLSLLSESNKKINIESIKHIIQALGQFGDCEAILALLICLRGQSFANDILKERYDFDLLASIPEQTIPVIDGKVYSVAITSCLRHDELGAADQILLSMKKNGLTLNQKSLKEILSEYCRMAMASSKEEYKAARVAKRQGLDESKFGILEPVYITSLARSKAALSILKAVDKPSPMLLSTVAKACCAAGLWQESRSILRRMHRAAIRELRQDSMSVSSNTVNGKFFGELPRLHRYLLKFCAKGGHITPALNFADDIQFLASRVRQHRKPRRGVISIDELEPELMSLSSHLLMDTPTPANIVEAGYNNVDSDAFSKVLGRPIGLTGQDWKLILIAAWRGGHWKVCVGTLPFIGPYVKETHPKYALESSSEATRSSSPYPRPSLEKLNRKYEQMANALTAAMLCFESRSQYAWAIRAMDDWIEWSGRRPRKQAVTAACRVLAKRYRGQEVLNLVAKVLSIPAIGVEEASLSTDSDYTYEKAIYTESINALHQSGLYDEADQLYAEGAANGHLPWAVLVSKNTEQLKLDLHGMSSAVAHSAVRVSLQQEIMRVQPFAPSSGVYSWEKDVIIITGRGRRSGERFRPVIRPEVQRMLTEEFFPPLGTSSIPGNMGALLVPSEDISAWLNNQRQKKGERLLFVADVLRDISSGNRLERALLSSGNRLEQALRKKLENDESQSNDESNEK
ncbi:predicted protein [Thalassiosira pseudonana CCMP1335]|uniref:Smr domain-containing protein n=1 Tax=Thalassiosira pseudonana TaxID=35128 RepID=B8LE47_THAPS|nr:predicted protein [Thalassiosira pseudonana CCMP1335]EED86401.1 predicted protein [Thalassiosira pseudonana CCMP1335]